MARACGIRIGAQRFELVALDGSAKNPKVAAAITGAIPPGADPVAATAAVLKEAVEGLKLNAENIGLAIDSGLAAFRTVKLPFDDPKKVEQVIKFEVENNLPQWSIEDVLVDWHVLSSSAIESVLLTTCVPKEALEPLLASCERAGVEPLEAELEATAVVNAAHQAGVLDPESSQIVVHVGESTTSVAVIDGGKLASIRAVHVGALPPVEAEAALLDEGEEEDEAEPAAAPAPVRDFEASVRRLRRELGRTVAAEQLSRPVAGIFVAGFELPGLIGDTIDEVPVLALEVLPEDGGKALEGLDARTRSELTVAYGTALAQLGGGLLHARLRREELHYAGKFERLELPLAVLALLIVTLLLVHVIVTTDKLELRDEGDIATKPGDMQLWLKSSNNFLFDDPSRDSVGRLPHPPADVLKYAREAERGEDLDHTKFEEILQVRETLKHEVLILQRELGDSQDFSQPMSALEGSTLVLSVLAELGESVGRTSIRQLKSTTTGGLGKPEKVIVTLDMTFFAQNDLIASQDYEKFYEAVRQRPWCLDFEPKKTSPLPEGNGISVDGIRFDVDVEKAMDL